MPVESPGWLASFGRRAIALEFAVAVAFVIYAGVHEFPIVFRGAPVGISARIDVSCAAVQQSQPCSPTRVELSPGRYRVVANETAALRVRLSPASDTAQVLVLRTSRPVLVSIGDHPVASIAEADGRFVMPVSGKDMVDVSVAPAVATDHSITIDEIGLFATIAGLRADARPIFRGNSAGALIQLATAVAPLGLLTVVLAAFLPASSLRRWTPLLLILLALAMSVVDLAILYSPYAGRDLRSFYAAGPLQDQPGNTLNEGLWQGMRLLHGDGLTLPDGKVPWERMPGYAVFCAIGGLLFGHRTLLDMAMSTVRLQTLFFGLSLGAFAWAAARVFPPAGVWAAGVLIAWLPKELGLAQVDAVIAPIMLLLLGALCLRVHAMRKGPVPLALDGIVHVAFAAWFVLRPDILPAWLVVSAVLHWRNWRRLAIPLALFVTIGGAWGLYRASHHGEFTFTTTSAGAGLFCGLFEVPSRFRYAMACSDGTYFSWVERHSPYHPQTAAANSFVTREVVRFWLTYPGHVIVMLFHKMLIMFEGAIWPGYSTALQAFVFGVVERSWFVVTLLAVVALCLVTGHQRERTLLMAWPLLLNAPLFWVLFASMGRFYSGAGVALVVAGMPPLFERSFYAALAARRGRAVAALACVLLLAAAAHSIDNWLARTDGFHYWTPLLDPAKSPLNEFK